MKEKREKIEIGKQKITLYRKNDLEKMSKPELVQQMLDHQYLLRKQVEKKKTIKKSKSRNG